jgi:hypothetical protein
MGAQCDTVVKRLLGYRRSPEHAQNEELESILVNVVPEVCNRLTASDLGDEDFVEPIYQDFCAVTVDRTEPGLTTYTQKFLVVHADRGPSRPAVWRSGDENRRISAISKHSEERLRNGMSFDEPALLTTPRARHRRKSLTPELSAPLAGAMTGHFIVHGCAPASC